MDRLQAVADVRQRAADDDAHRVVEVARSAARPRWGRGGCAASSSVMRRLPCIRSPWLDRAGRRRPRARRRRGSAAAVSWAALVSGAWSPADAGDGRPDRRAPASAAAPVSASRMTHARWPSSVAAARAASWRRNAATRLGSTWTHERSAQLSAFWTFGSASPMSAPISASARRCPGRTVRRRRRQLVRHPGERGADQAPLEAVLGIDQLFQFSPAERLVQHAARRQVGQLVGADPVGRGACEAADDLPAALGIVAQARARGERG